MFSEIETYLKSCKKTNFWDEEAILSNIKSILNHYKAHLQQNSDIMEGRIHQKVL